MTAIAPVYGSPEWVADRRNYIGASEVAMIVGESPWGSAYDLWCKKRGIVEDTPNKFKKRGHRFEPVIAEMYAEQFDGVVLERCDTTPHAVHPWLRATPDRLVRTPDGLAYPLEIKTVHYSKRDEWGTPGTDEVPDEYFIQAQVQCEVFDAPFAHVAPLLSLDELPVFVVRRDPDLFADLMVPTIAFHERHMLGDEEPPITGPNTHDHLRRRYKTHSAHMLTANESANEWMRKLAQAKSDKEVAKALESEAKAALMEIIGNNRGIVGSAGRVTWSETAGRSTLDTKALLAHLKVPDAVEQQFTRVGQSFRTFRFSEPKQ